MRVYLYILENKNKKHYIGISRLSPEIRLGRHNRGEVFSTRFNKPWKVIYIEVHNNYSEARKREKQIKN